MRTQNEIRADLVRVEVWARAAYRDPDEFTPMAKKLLVVNRHQLLKELIAVQLETFDQR